mmetsp:Transcript_28735/g.61028  ORF Transcript_28735/g.61028 Transcript_28735/m.61028 type:complete len:213 (+) Transcript_28735:627-1265(+)
MGRSGRSPQRMWTASGARSCARRLEVVLEAQTEDGASRTPSACMMTIGVMSGTGGRTDRPLPRWGRKDLARLRKAPPSRAFASTSMNRMSTQRFSSLRAARPSASTTSGAWRWLSTTGFCRALAVRMTPMRRTSSSCRTTRPASSTTPTPSRAATRSSCALPRRASLSRSCATPDTSGARRAVGIISSFGAPAWVRRDLSQAGAAGCRMRSS